VLIAFAHNRSSQFAWVIHAGSSRKIAVRKLFRIERWGCKRTFANSRLGDWRNAIWKENACLVSSGSTCSALPVMRPWEFRRSIQANSVYRLRPDKSDGQLCGSPVSSNSPSCNGIVGSSFRSEIRRSGLKGHSAASA